MFHMISVYKRIKKSFGTVYRRRERPPEHYETQTYQGKSR